MGRKPIDLTGQKFGKLTALKIVEHGGAHHPVKWMCKCDCGNHKIVESQLLKRGLITDCGCKIRNRLVGQRFGRLVVLEPTERKSGKAGNITWKCQCDCGNITFVGTGNLCSSVSPTLSCGCYRKEVTAKHNMCKTRIYHTYKAMVERCSNPNHKQYALYGGRGIKVCEKWSGETGFFAFYTWSVINGYNDDLSIDRIDNNKGYSPDNCRWATAKQQANNTRRNHYVVINGEKHTLTEWAEIKGICIGTVRDRIKRGWPEEKAILEPIKKRD